MEKEANEFDVSLRLIAKSSVIVFVSIFLSKIFAYLYRIIIAREFGPEVYGLFSLAIMILGFFATFSIIGLDAGITRYVPFYRGRDQKDKIRYVFKFTFKILLGLSIFFGILLFLLSDFISIGIFNEPDLSIFLKIFAPLIPISVISFFFLSAIRSYELIGWHSFIQNVIENLGKVLFISLLIFFGLGVLSVPMSYFLGISVILIISYFVSKRYIPSVFEKTKMKPKQKKAIRTEILKYSIPLSLFSVVYIILNWIDSFFLGYFKTAREVGLYNAAVPIAFLLTISSVLFMKLFLPLINKEYGKKNLGLIRELSKQTGKWVFFINLPLFILMLLFPGTLLNILFGPEYLVAADSLRFLAVGMLMFSVFRISEKLISMEGRSRLLLLDVTIAVALNVILNIILIPMSKILFWDNATGITGASIATMISTLLLNSLFLIQARKDLSITPVRRKMLNIALASVIPTLLLLYLRNVVTINAFSMIFLFILFVLLYIFFVLMFRGFDKKDYMIFNDLKRKMTRNHAT